MSIDFNPFTGTFDLVGSSAGASTPNFSYENITSTVTVPLNQQMLVHQSIQIDATLILNGTLVIL